MRSGDTTVTGAELARLLGDRLVLITQNVDDLHERGGSRAVLHMHGELLKARCVECGDVVSCERDMTLSDACGACAGRMRPHIVWFEEVPFYLDEEIPRALQAEVFLSIGTSGSVYPAAGMVVEAKRHGAVTIEANLEPSGNARWFDHQVLGPTGTTLPELVAEIVGA